MAHFQTVVFLGVLILAVGLAACADEQERASPKRFAPVIIPGGDVVGCASNEDRQAALDLISSMSQQLV